MTWVRLFRGRWPELKRFFHVPNGGLRSKRTAAKMKAMGQEPGVLDYWLPIPSAGYNGLIIEMKRPGGYLTPEQKDWSTDMQRYGWLVEVCRSADEAIHVLESYLRRR